MKNSYRDAMDALRFTPEQKADMVEHLLSAPAAGKVVRPLRFRRFAAAGAAGSSAVSSAEADVLLKNGDAANAVLSRRAAESAIPAVFRITIQPL